MARKVLNGVAQNQGSLFWGTDNKDYKIEVYELSPCLWKVLNTTEDAAETPTAKILWFGFGAWMLDVVLVPKDAMYELAKSLQTSCSNAGLHSGGSCTSQKNLVPWAALSRDQKRNTMLTTYYEDGIQLPHGFPRNQALYPKS